MSSDRRWTGGAANREWQRGTQPLETLLPRDYIAAQIRAYQADCYAARKILNPRYHPTAAGFLKLIPHQGDMQRHQILREYAKASSPREYYG
jgi:hypothetical protein